MGLASEVAALVKSRTSAKSFSRSAAALESHPDLRGSPAVGVGSERGSRKAGLVALVPTNMEPVGGEQKGTPD